MKGSRVDPCSQLVRSAEIVEKTFLSFRRSLTGVLKFSIAAELERDAARRSAEQFVLHLLRHARRAASRSVALRRVAPHSAVPHRSTEMYVAHIFCVQ